MMTGDVTATEMAMPTLCRTCVYRERLNRPLGREDQPRLRGIYRNGHIERPCILCNCNPHLRLFYAPNSGRVRQLKGFSAGFTTRKRKLSLPVDQVMFE